MPYTEFQEWLQFFEQRPIGWREDLRTAHILTSLGQKKAPAEMFASLKKMQESRTVGESLMNSAFFKRMLDAKGGDKVEGLC
jgi:hypothetical protein